MHQSFEMLAHRTDAEFYREAVQPQHLTVMRVEAIDRGREPAAIVDLHFVLDGRRALVPLVLVDVPMAIVREADPLVFPRHLAIHLDEHAVRDIVDHLAPELARRALDRDWDEGVLRFRSDDAFDHARASGWFGAVALERSVPPLARAVYARRFVGANQAVTYGPHAAGLAALLRFGNEDVTAQDADAASRAWWDCPSSEQSGAIDLAVGSGEGPAARVTVGDAPGAVLVPVVVPLATDVLVSFDPADGPLADTFAVSGARETVRRSIVSAGSAPRTGSSGRIALVVRADAAALPAADTHLLSALAEQLAGAGFTVGVASDVADVEAFGPDLVHAIGVRPGAGAAAVARWCAAAQIPFVAHAFDLDANTGGFWGALATRYCFAYSADDRSVRAYLELLARRAVTIDTVSSTSTYAPIEEEVGESVNALRLATCIFVESEADADSARAVAPGVEVVVVAPLFTLSVEHVDIAPLVGEREFILVHAPLVPESNILLTVRAARELESPIVVAGAVGDPSYLELIREFAAADTRILSEPTSAQETALYACAEIVVDAAWVHRGGARLAAAIAAGATVVAPTEHHLGVAVAPEHRCDRADVRSIARALGAAYNPASRRQHDAGSAAEFVRNGARATFTSVLNQYARVAERV